MKRIIAATIALTTLSGCASIISGKTQPVSVQTMMDNKEVSGVTCSLQNDEGKWFITTPGSTVVHKSTADMAVDCKTDTANGHETAVSKSNGPVWGNLVFGGLIGYIVDRNTGAGFDYPSNITIMLKKAEAAVGLAPAAPAAGEVAKK
jgi:hypothetical protein